MTLLKLRRNTLFLRLIFSQIFSKSSSEHLANSVVLRKGLFPILSVMHIFNDKFIFQCGLNVLILILSLDVSSRRIMSYHQTHPWLFSSRTLYWELYPESWAFFWVNPCAYLTCVKQVCGVICRVPEIWSKALTEVNIFNCSLPNNEDFKPTGQEQI